MLISHPSFSLFPAALVSPIWGILLIVRSKPMMIRAGLAMTNHYGGFGIQEPNIYWLLFLRLLNGYLLGFVPNATAFDC